MRHVFLSYLTSTFFVSIPHFSITQALTGPQIGNTVPHMELLGGFSYAGSYIKQGTRDTPGMVARIISTKFCFLFPYPPPLFPCLSFPFPRLPLLSYLAPAHLHPIPNPPPHLPSFFTSRISRTWI